MTTSCDQQERREPAQLGRTRRSGEVGRTRLRRAISWRDGPRDRVPDERARPCSGSRELCLERPHQARRLLELIEAEEAERAALAEDAAVFREETLG
jgi:hypothetical protein